MKVVIIGGVAGGASAAARLRRLDETAQIILLERGGEISYANCGLPYYVGGEITDREELTLQTPESFRARFAVDVRVRQEAVAIDPAEKTVTVRRVDSGETYRETYDKLLLSPGAEPVRPSLPGVEDSRVMTLRTVPDAIAFKEYLDRRSPARAVVVGGGFIGLEMAENLSRAGLAVVVAEYADHVAASLDREMAADVHHHLRKKGIGLRLGRGVKAFHPREDCLEVELDGGERLPADLAVLSVGVRPDTHLAREAGLELGERGAIRVDAHMRTSQPDIYAVGDAVETRNPVTGKAGYLPLAGPANKQGRIAADNLCGIPSEYRGTQGTSILRLFHLTVAATGLGEGAARKAGISFHKIYTFSASHAGYYPGATAMSIKALFEAESGKLLGAQIVGRDGVDKRIDVMATAIRGGMTAGDLAELELAYAPPFSSAKDPVNMVGFAAENVLTGKVHQYHLEEIPALREEGAAFLDVRNPGEFRRGSIPGAVNIPLDSLRQRLEELDSARPLYVNCQSGLRSYVACRILTQHGFDCYNLAGGYRLYRSVETDRGV